MTWIEDEVDCKADDEPFLTQLYCFVPLTTLRSTTYNLGYNDLVVAKARAYNSKGFGHYSEPNILGALVSQKPSLMDIVRINKDTSTLTTITVEWDALTTGEQTGGSAIDSYNLIWDAGTNGDSWQNVQGQEDSFSVSTTATVVGLTAGQYYQFRVIAHNVHGWADELSEIVSFQAA